MEDKMKCITDELANYEPMMELEEVEAILYDGTYEQIANLPRGVSYEYSPEYKSMRIKAGIMLSIAHGSPLPNCVEHFGNKHAF